LCLFLVLYAQLRVIQRAGEVVKRHFERAATLCAAEVVQFSSDHNCAPPRHRCGRTDGRVLACLQSLIPPCAAVSPPFPLPSCLCVRYWRLVCERPKSASHGTRACLRAADTGHWRCGSTRAPFGVAGWPAGVAAAHAAAAAAAGGADAELPG